MHASLFGLGDVFLQGVSLGTELWFAANHSACLLFACERPSPSQHQLTFQTSPLQRDFFFFPRKPPVVVNFPHLVPNVRASPPLWTRSVFPPQFLGEMLLEPSWRIFQSWYWITFPLIAVRRILNPFPRKDSLLKLCVIGPRGFPTVLFPLLQICHSNLFNTFPPPRRPVARLRHRFIRSQSRQFAMRQPLTSDHF